MSRYQFMQKHAQRFDRAEMSEALVGSRGGYYRWREAKPSTRRQNDEVITTRIEQISRRVIGPYGYRPVHAHLVEEGVACGRDRHAAPDA